jgi:two-component system, OmpR family, response regulator
MTDKCILVVDDEPSVRRLLAAALRQSGFSVCLASSGEEAVALYEQHRGTIDLVLLDVRMETMDGPRTLAALRELDPQVRCCFMSGHAGEYSDDDLLALGASHVFSKPFGSLNELTQTLRHFVAGGA